MPRTDASSSPRRRNGFTLMELMVVLVIMAIVLSIGGAMMTGYMRSSRLREATREVSNDFEVIRNTARTRQRAVVAFVTPNSVRAELFDDADNNGIYGPGEVLQGAVVDHTLTTSVQLSVIGEAAALMPVTTIHYTALGTLPDDRRTVTLQLPADLQRQYRILLYTTGRTQVQRSDDAGVTWRQGF